MKISLMCEEGLSFGQVRDEVYIGQALSSLGVTFLNNQVVPDVDLILTFKTRRYGVQHIDEWRNITKAPIWVWTFDNMDRFPQWYPFIKKCDLWLGEELGRKARWEQEGLPFYYFPYHAVPDTVSH